tara:strand:+ start:9943 stop:10449 length:507 start_codon:yes stop_codon:yes gene_type:complete
MPKDKKPSDSLWKLVQIFFCLAVFTSVVNYFDRRNSNPPPSNPPFTATLTSMDLYKEYEGRMRLTIDPGKLVHIEDGITEIDNKVTLDYVFWEFEDKNRPLSLTQSEVDAHNLVRIRLTDTKPFGKNDPDQMIDTIGFLGRGREIYFYHKGIHPQTLEQMSQLYFLRN